LRKHGLNLLNIRFDAAPHVRHPAKPKQAAGE
jgi:hypothetical protein